MGVHAGKVSTMERHRAIDRFQNEALATVHLGFLLPPTQLYMGVKE